MMPAVFKLQRIRVRKAPNIFCVQYYSQRAARGA